MDPLQNNHQNQDQEEELYANQEQQHLVSFSKPILPTSSSLVLLPAPTPRPPQHAVVGPTNRYRECLRNHAAAVGGHVVDGCGEFMPSSSADPLTCAACGCHRSFHRKEHHNFLLGPAVRTTPETNVTNCTKFQQRAHHQITSAMTESSSEDGRLAKTNKKKRFRTKFSEEQKDKMKRFADRIGWRVQKKDEGEMERFCKDVGVSRQVVKVWMHNNKHLNVKRSFDHPKDCDDDDDDRLIRGEKDETSS